jgi:hypothetical protein
MVSSISRDPSWSPPGTQGDDATGGLVVPAVLGVQVGCEGGDDLGCFFRELGTHGYLTLLTIAKALGVRLGDILNDVR